MTTQPAVPSTLTLPQLESELLGLAGHLAAAQCRFLRLLAEFDAREGWAGPGLKSCAHWLSWRIGMSLRTAHEHLRVAHALRELPRIDEAFAAGHISYSKVRAITRICGRDADPEPAKVGREPGEPADRSDGSDPPSDLPGSGTDETRASADARIPAPADAEQTLLDLALGGTASHVETVVRAVRRRHHDPTRAGARRSVTWRWADDGSLILRARLTPAEGAALTAAIDGLAEPLRSPTPNPTSEPPESWQERADEEVPGAVTDRVAARRADALLQLATAGAAGPAATTAEGASTPSILRGQAQVVVHIDATAGTAALAGGPEIPLPTAERLACDARAQVLLQDTTQNRLYLGRNRRLATAAQITALGVRDGGRCQFPGCTHTRHLHAHHVVGWLRGGRTDVDNLVLLCGFHHTLIHDRGYRIRRVGGRWEVRRPNGAPVPAGAPPLDGNVESLIESHTRAALRITPTGLTPSWAGDRLDPTPILQLLLPPLEADQVAA